MKKTGLISGLLLLLISQNAIAVDSYRFLHVSIDTPWILFIFLLCIIMIPFILSAILYWYFAAKKNKAEAENEGNE